MTDFEQQLTDHLRERAAAATPRFDLEAVEQGIGAYALVDLGERRRRRPVIVAMVGVAAAVALFVAIALVRATPDEDDSTPVTEPDVEQGPVTNGSIVTGDGHGWPEGPAPARPDEPEDHEWNAFDQDTGSFLYVSGSGTRVWVIGRDRQEADFPCAAPVICGWTTFGPGPDEVTAPTDGPDGPQSVQVMALDGTVRDTLDISAAVADDAFGQPQELSDLAWSPDGSRLAVGTEPEFGCSPRGAECEAEVWIFDRDGGEPQRVHAESTPAEQVDGQYWDTPMLTGLAWSPDGRRLGLLVGSTYSNDHPRLLALHLPPGEPTVAETLHVFDARDWRSEGTLIPADNDLHYAFAWSPDGSRLAVTSEGGVAEIAAEDGDVLTRHHGFPGQAGVHGPLAWLPER